MIIDDPLDRKYAKALQATFRNVTRLTPEEIDKTFRSVGYAFFGDNNQPKNLMLQDIYTNVVFDELDPHFPGNDHAKSLERFQKITNDFLRGDFYSTYFVLRGCYSNKEEGFEWTIMIENSSPKLTCGNETITSKIREILAVVVLSSDDERDLLGISSIIPRHIDNLSLTHCDVEEHLTPHI